MRGNGTEPAQKAAGKETPEAVEEEKILLAEYALDFVMQAVNRALLLCVEAVGAQTPAREKERK